MNDGEWTRVVFENRVRGVAVVWLRADSCAYMVATLDELRGRAATGDVVGCAQILQSVEVSYAYEARDLICRLGGLKIEGCFTSNDICHNCFSHLSFLGIGDLYDEDLHASSRAFQISYNQCTPPFIPELEFIQASVRSVD